MSVKIRILKEVSFITNLNFITYEYIIILFHSPFPDVVSRRRHSRSKDEAVDIDGKIVGGYNTTIQDAPYQVYLLLQMGNTYYQCGGSIISERYVLTAAHCLTG